MVEGHVSVIARGGSSPPFGITSLFSMTYRIFYYRFYVFNLIYLAIEILYHRGSS